METQDIIQLLNQENARIKAADKINGKNIVLTVCTTDGKELKLKTGTDGNFLKPPELLNGIIKIGVADPMLATSTTTDTGGGSLAVTTTQPVTFYYLPVENIVSMRFDCVVATTNQVATVTEG